MADKTSIEWTRGDDGTPGATWNPVTGCTKVSPGCDNCYAETFAERWRGTPGHYFEQGFDVQLRPDKLDQPFRRKKPRRIFVNSMSDLFHDAVPDEYIARVFAVMAQTPQHTYQLLTKRHGRMRSLLTRVQNDWDAFTGVWPLPNLWLGVSVEDQKRADLRIPALLDTPAAVRWLSCEPLLGPVDLANVPWPSNWLPARDVLHWVVVGGESGLRSRPMQVDWARSLRDQCTSARIPFFFKQWGGRTPKANGRELDGRTWDEYPRAAEVVA